MKTIGCILLLLASAAAWAHKSSDSYLNLVVDDNRVQVRWDIALRDLDDAVGLDGNDDGVITWGELRSRASEVAAYASARLTLAAGAAVCPLAQENMLVDEHTDGVYAALSFHAVCPSAIDSLTIDYRLLFDLDPQHRGLLKLDGFGKARTAVLGPDSGRRTIALRSEGDSGRAFRDYLWEGVWHIWIGTDHVLFLLSLLIPAVLVRTGAGWAPAASFRPALWDVVRVVTAFTAAHSVTLALAGLGILDLPSRWVESAIAASVVLAALNNLFPRFQTRRASLAFGFGLVHGLGFASVLSDLGLSGSLRWLGLLSFNLGVEAGQLAIVALFLPLAYLLSRRPVYRLAVLRGGSGMIAATACLWLAERSLDIQVW